MACDTTDRTLLREGWSFSLRQFEKFLSRQRHKLYQPQCWVSWSNDELPLIIDPKHGDINIYKISVRLENGVAIWIYMWFFSMLHKFQMLKELELWSDHPIENGDPLIQSIHCPQLARLYIVGVEFISLRDGQFPSLKVFGMGDLDYVRPYTTKKNEMEINERWWAGLEWLRERGIDFLSYPIDQFDDLRFVIRHARSHHLDHVRLAKWLLLSHYHSHGNSIRNVDLHHFSPRDRNETLRLLCSLRLNDDCQLGIRLYEDEPYSVADIIPKNIVSLKIYGCGEVGGRVIFDVLKSLPKLKTFEIWWEVEILEDGKYRPGRWFTFANVSGLRAIEGFVDSHGRDPRDVETYEITITRGNQPKWLKCPGLGCERRAEEVGLPKFNKEIMDWFKWCPSMQQAYIDISRGFY